MGLLGAVGFSLALVSLTQIPYSAEGCKILSATPKDASRILVKWEQHPAATNYFLDLRVKNNVNVAPNVVTLRWNITEVVVSGLRPGTEYSVTLKVLHFYSVVCQVTISATTVPDTSQIVYGKALTSTSIMVKWNEEPSAEYYFLLVRSQATGQTVNFTHTEFTAVVENLQPATNYDCYVYTVNSAGPGKGSKVRTITTLTKPPENIMVMQTGKGTARVMWHPVEDVLLYQVSIRDTDEPDSSVTVYNVTDTNLDVHGIHPCSTYLISVSSFNAFLLPSEPTTYTYTTNKLTPVSSVTVDYTCTTHTAMVQWTAVFGAESYAATAKADNGTQLSCTSLGTSCQITGLSCGQSYMVHVMPVSDSCTNMMNATSATFQTVPCPPNNLELLRDCSSEVIIFSWERTNNTDHYIARAVDSQGIVQECLTEDNSCFFTHTVCGRHYYFTVYSITGHCRSQISSTVDIRTAPCIPQNVQTSADCGSDVLLSKWDLAEGALNYTVEAFGNKGTNNHYTCSSMSNSCAMEGIHCGDLLTIYITAYDNECASPRSLGPVAETVPCAPFNVSAVKECGADSISVSWITTGSAVFYVAMAKDSYGVSHQCITMGRSCKIEGLKCSTNYTAYVLASNFVCNSTASETVTIETAACPPHHVMASLDCAANEALISWYGHPEMKSYTATIVDEGQGLLSCSSTNTSCWVSNLKCSQVYTVTVSYHDGMCPSQPSEPIYMESVPCGPSVTPYLDCQSQVLTLSWTTISNAEGYISVISSSDKQMSYNTTEPELTVNTLECGYNYTLTVMSFNGTCVGQPSVLPVGKMPCVPTDVMVMKNCSQNYAYVIWQASYGALSYQAAAKDGYGHMLRCSSNDTSCKLEGLMCGKVYNVCVTATNDKCTSNESDMEMLYTAPCPPSQVDVSLNCANNSAMLTWNSSPNALYYTGKAVSTDGHTMTCDAGMNHSCQLHSLRCGKEYTFTVSASDGDCQSPYSEPVRHTTAPCAVESVLNKLNCGTGTLTISWWPGSIPVNYSAIALASDGTALRCVTAHSRCTLNNLPCGQQYTVMVKAISSTCEGESSVPEIVNTAPCVPMNVEGGVECSTNTFWSSWDETSGAASYMATLMGAGGSYYYLHTVNQSSLFTGLQCAQTYMLNVVALNDRCNSSVSANISATTVPCDPTNVMATLDCDSDVVTVSWGSSAGAHYYTVVAEAYGHVDSCVSTNTSCDLSQLHCGEFYTVKVLAGDGVCNSSLLATTNITTAPCPPVIQDHYMDCVSNHASVTWVEDEDAMSVMVSATSTLDSSMVFCTSASNHSCILEELLCGHTYTVQAVADGPQCQSKPSSSFQVMTAPCTPSNVEYTYSCETGIALLNWDETLGRKDFYAHIQSADQMDSCHTGLTHCSLSSLICGSLYNVTVIAVADHCNSSVPGVTQIQTAPCPPVNVSASLVCENNTAAVSWLHSPGVVYYKVAAVGRQGDVKECTSNGTTCHLSHLHCAQMYLITVTPFSDRCQGFDSYAYSYTAGPCPPTNIDVSLQCVGNIGHVTWTAAQPADYYVATVLPSGLGDPEHSCSSNGTSCSLTDLQCGQTTVVTVATMERGCMSEPSLPFTFQTVICPPTGVTGVTTCVNNDITVSWNQSPVSGATYMIHSHKDGGASANYSMSQTSQVITGLQCGELYTLTAAAVDTECTSVYSEPIITETAPCPPTNLSVRAVCGTNMGMLTWEPSYHAVSYTATVSGTHGHVVSCSSNTTSCSVKLNCGKRYSAVLIASSATCDSIEGAPLTFDSAPCLPDRVVADLDCNANSFVVQWLQSNRDLSIYTAIAIGSDDSRMTCNTNTTSCAIENLTCGLRYSIVVTTSSIDCGTIVGSDYSKDSAPCKPEMVQVNLQCSTNIATVTWDNMGPDQTQVVSAEDGRGMIMTCNSTSSNCSFDQLTCGERYTISVVGHTDTCRSQPTIAEMLYAAPCAPTHITAQVDCVTGITVVTWDPALGATSYTVYAHGSLGYDAECDSTDTFCDFSYLACGQDYNITVMARSHSCVSLISESIMVTTGPCPHSGLTTELDCDTNTAVVSWTPGSGILYYNASADAFGISHLLTCSTFGSSCNISSLQCGESYRVTVSGQGYKCPSPAQDWFRVISAPCPPTQLVVDASCESDNITVSWQASKGAASYMAMAEDAEGRRWSCNTSRTSCQMSGLPCGRQYMVYAAGVDENCIGAKSNVEVIHTAPCVPQNVRNSLDCHSGVLNITWQSMGHVVQFCTYVSSSGGHMSSCETNEHHCLMHNMECGLTYNVSVVAQDEVCNSSYSPKTEVATAPCPLTNFHPAVDCASGVVSVTWNNSAPGVMYTVSAAKAMEVKHQCNSTNGGCDLSMLECGSEYNITITPSRNGCVGRDSTTKMITTVPCVPHLTEVEIDCLYNSAWVMYEESAGAEDYFVMTTDSYGYIQSFQCNSTSDGMCSVPPLICSQNLTFTLEASDQRCSSGPSNAITTETAPCPPASLMKWVGCDNRTATIAWSDVPGALTYTATLEKENGEHACCTTSESSCDISGLPCGEVYILLVMSEGRTCNSSQSEGDILRTVPCIPQNLQANLSCSNNVASMSWKAEMGLGHMYRVTAVGPDGHAVECNSFEFQCDLMGLHCGQHYTASVTAEDTECKSAPSDSVLIKTRPCTPAVTSAEMDCESNALMVSWSNSPGADSYIAMVQDSNGHMTTCQGMTEGYCSVAGVSCGQIYHVSVVSSDGYCNSLPTPAIDTPQVPCEPMHIEAVMDCYTHTALVEWYPSDGALMYEVMATSALDHSVICEALVPNCDLEGLLCGQWYYVSVKAVGLECNSTAHMTGHLITEPCIPEHISTQYGLTIGQVLWDTSSGAEYYTVEGVTEHGLMVSCNTSDTYCAVFDLACSQEYVINVTAHNHVCKGLSTSTEAVVIITEPCPPNNLVMNIDCQSDMVTASWEASYGAVSYKVTLAGRDGHQMSCSSNETFCSTDGLHCGTTYHASVIAVRETLISNPSTTVLLDAAPCAAENVMAYVDCYNDSAEVSWSSASGAISYTAWAMGTNGHMISCDTDELRCELKGLQCGQTYKVYLTTNSEDCQIETHTNVTFCSRPCAPLRVGVDLLCGTSVASMYWEEREDVEFYLATATSVMGMIHYCNTTNSTCDFSNLHCGESYMFAVTAHSYMCYSEVSSTVEGHTGPCQPTGLAVSGSCENETVMLDWSVADGALIYQVMATGDLGYVTSFQTNETMIEAELPCGQMFNFTVKAQNDRCDSAVSLTEQFKTGPCVPRHVQSFTQCEDSLGAVSWAQSDGAEYYMAIAVGLDSHTHMCITNTTTCTWDDLHCGEQYTIHVLANDYQCSSMPSNSTSIQMAPCIPANLEASLNCSMKVGSMTWNASETANYYILTAESNSGHKVQLSTNETWAYISEFHCGEEYYLSVQAADTECTSRPSQPAMFYSEPCPPTGVSSLMNCVSNIAVVSWNRSEGAEFYTAVVMEEDGQATSCWSDSEECGIPNVICGKNYTVTVVASNKDCHSDPSEMDTLQSVPCVPTDVIVRMNCSDNQAMVSWSASEGALSYGVRALSEMGDVSYCDTTDQSCPLSNLTCGRTYTVQVVAQDNICSSLPTPAMTFQSAPCTPYIGDVVLDCYTNSALLTWAYAAGATNYTATAVSSNGYISTCTSNYTNCELMDLHCGEIYNVTTVAMTDECSSPPSAVLQVESVPCPPEDVEHYLDCSTNTARVEWQASKGADYYIVQALGVREHVSGCETDWNSCELSDLMCGFTYNISVMSVNSVCNVSYSSMTQLKAVPCIPQYVQARVDCETDGVVVSWEPSKGASSYMAVAQGNGGYVSTCDSNQTTCLFDDLLCGLNYSITISASDEMCSSAGSSVVELSTVPCEPQKVSAEMMCGNDTGLVSWEEEEGVASYMVRAYGPDGHKIMCNSTTTTCQLPSMHCGQLYNVTVTALDGECDNSYVHLNLQSVPCWPTNVKASLLCRSNAAAVTWEKASGALSYLVVGVTEDGSHQTGCDTNMTYCDLNDLRCGQTYKVSVFGLDDTCSSVESMKSQMRTAPCAPQDVDVTSMCADGAITVSWAPNPDAQYFHVSAVSSTMMKQYCNSTSTNCTLSNLPCGQYYNVTVQSVRDNCESKPSAVIETCTAPCLPEDVTGRLDCVTNAAWVTWEEAEGVSSYIVLAHEDGGHNYTCTTSSSPCNIPDLKCGTTYTIYVSTVNKHCYSNSSNSTTFELVTGPCTLTAIDVETECYSDTLYVEWEAAEDTPIYLVTAEGHDQSLLSCNSSGSSCEIYGARCGMYYSVIVSAASDKCSSLRSPPKKIKTAPCVPDNVTVVPSCDDNGAMITWGHSHVATSYMVTATGRDGHVLNYNTSVNNFSLSDLHCGQPYSLTISARGDNCTSPPWMTSFTSVPCEPSGLQVDIDCETNSAALSWNPSEGTMEYYGCAKSMDGDMIYCNSTVASCMIEGLECGEVYNFSVEAFDGFCNSSFSAPLQEGAAPCPPADLNVRLQKIGRNHWVLASWDMVDCPGVEYLVEVMGQIQNNPQALIEVSSYWLSRTFFELPLPCSTAYSLTVRSRNAAGVSEPSDAFNGITAPCAPQNVKYTGNSQSAVLSWDASVFATSYTVYNGSGEDRVKLCETADLSCQLTNFEPNATEVTASNAEGESNPNGDVTGPGSRRRRDLRRNLIMFHKTDKNLEMPQVLSIRMRGLSLYVKWKSVTGASSYTLLIEERKSKERANHTPEVIIVESDVNFHIEKNLRPWTTYCIRLAAKSILNQSFYSFPVCKTTKGP